MDVKAWTNGRGTYGVRVGRQDAKMYFAPGLEGVEVEVDGEVCHVRLRETFWTTCPELRGGIVGQWVRRIGAVPWIRGAPPALTLTPLGGGRFRLSA